MLKLTVGCNMSVFAINILSRYKFLLVSGIVFLSLFTPLLSRVAHAAPPETTMIASIREYTVNATPTFTFSSSQAPSTFECSLDGAVYAACASPYTTIALSQGAHTFNVRAINSGPETDPTPASFAWTQIAPLIGGGVHSNPLFIYNCQQLVAIHDNIGAAYDLSSDIDCGGMSIAPLGDSSTPFTGELTGVGHKISNLDVEGLADAGIFGVSSGAIFSYIELENIQVNGTHHVGTLVGSATNTNISNIFVSSGSVSGSGNYVGGVVGYMGGGTMINVSTVSTSVGNPGAATGGLAGYVTGPVTVSDSYASGQISGATSVGERYVGGLIGQVDAGPAIISSNYANMEFTNLTDYNGGFAGYIHTDATVDDNFSVSDMRVGGGTNIGGFVGESNSTAIGGNDYFDEYRAGVGACTASGSAVCTAVNAGNSQPNFFKDNHTNGPLSSWDFGGTGHNWHQSRAYPDKHLYDDVDSDMTSDSDEANGPNVGDANNDGLNDGSQGYVNASINPITGKYIAIETQGCDEVSNVQIGQEPSAENAKDKNNDYPAGLVGFDARICSVGATATISVYYYGNYDASKFSLRKYRSSDNAYSMITGVSYNNFTIDGHAVLKATYSITDGGPLDDDGMVNGSISDPVGLALGVASAPNTGLGHQNGILTASSVLAGFILVASTPIIRTYRKD